MIFDDKAMYGLALGMLLDDAARVIQDPTKFPEDIKQSVVAALKEQSASLLKVVKHVIMSAALEDMAKLPPRGEGQA